MAQVSAPALPAGPEEAAAAFGDLPTLAPVAARLISLADDDSATLEQLAHQIEHDPALAGQILRVANSAGYGLGKPTTSLVRATSVLGLRMVKLLSLSFSVLTRPDRSNKPAARLWRHTLICSALARSLAAERDPRLSDECFVAALLADVGRVALIQGHAAYAAHAAAGPLSVDDERRVLGFTGDDVSALLMASWGLPEVLVAAARHRSDPHSASGQAARLARVLAVADAAARLVTAEEPETGGALERYRSVAAQHLDLAEAEADRILVDAGPGLTQVAELFDEHELHAEPLEVLLVRAKAGLAKLSLDLAVALSDAQARSELLVRENRRLSVEATTDTLTGLPNRRAYLDVMARLVARRPPRHAEAAFGLLIMDIDHFKAVNDTYGHPVGDEVLRCLADRVVMHTRRDEFVARLGGEEFALVVPAVDVAALREAAERFRRAIGDSPFVTAVGPIQVTVSLGAAWVLDLAPGAADGLYDAADSALREAKNAGRNRAVVVGD